MRSFSLISSLLVFFLFVFIERILAGVFHLAYRILDFALGLLGGAMNLHFRVVSPFASLALHSSGNIFHLSYYLILIHKSP